MTATSPRLAWPARYVATGKDTSRLQDGSDLWLALAQLEHGPLDSEELADILDVARPRATSLINGWVRSGYLRRLYAHEAAELGLATAQSPKPRVPARPDARYDAVRAWIREHGRITIDEVVAVTGLNVHQCHSWAGYRVWRGDLSRIDRSVWVLNEAGV